MKHGHADSLSAWGLRRARPCRREAHPERFSPGKRLRAERARRVLSRKELAELASADDKITASVENGRVGLGRSLGGWLEAVLDSR